MTAFNVSGFYAALEAHRRGLGISWKNMADEAGISASTLSRMSHGKYPDVTSLAALVSWSGIDVSNFFTSVKKNEKKSSLVDITSMIEMDKTLDPKGKKIIESVLNSLYEAYKI